MKPKAKSKAKAKPATKKKKGKPVTKAKPKARAKPKGKGKPRPKAKPGDQRLGNQFWKIRTQHGRKKLFSSPKILWDEACKYFQWCDDHPLHKTEQTKGRSLKLELDDNGKATGFDDSGLTQIPLMRAYTWEGLELFLQLESLREYKTNEDYKDFSQVIGLIGKIIYTQKFAGAASGLLNANIIARDLGLSDKQELTGRDGESLFGNVSDEKAKELAKKIKGSSK